MRWVADSTNMNVNPRASTSSRFVWGVHTTANEDLSYFGIVGGWLALSCLLFVGARSRRTGPSTCRLPGALDSALRRLLALHSTYNAWLGRFLLVPLALALPLLAYAWAQPFRIALAAVAALTLLGTAIDNDRKPLDSHPWAGGRDNALRNSIDERLAGSTAALDRVLQGEKCVVALVGGDDPSYLVFGPHLERRILYVDNARAALSGTVPVVLGPTVDATSLTDAGWHVEPALGYWRIARPPHAPVSPKGNQCDER